MKLILNKKGLWLTAGTCLFLAFLFIKTYEDLEDLKFVLDRSVKTQYTKDIKSTKVPDIYDIDLD